jgi:hypothetical protein
MSFFYLKDDVKSIIAKHLTNDYKIVQCLCLNIKIYKKYYLVRLYLRTIFI